MFSRGYVILLLILLPTPSWALIGPLDQIADLGKNLGGVADLFGAGSELLEVADILDASNDLGEELGAFDGEGDKNKTIEDLNNKIKETRDLLYDAGYTKDQVDSLLFGIESDKSTLSHKIRTLTRTVRGLKKVRRSFKKLMGNPQADSMARQGMIQGQLQTNAMLAAMYKRDVEKDLSKVRREAAKNKKIIDDYNKSVEEKWKDQLKGFYSNNKYKNILSLSEVKKASEILLLVPAAVGVILIATGVFTGYGVGFLALSFIGMFLHLSFGGISALLNYHLGGIF